MLTDFCCHSGDFYTFLHDSALAEKVMRVWINGKSQKCRIIGSTELKDDILLHLTFVNEGQEDKVLWELIEENGVAFEFLKTVIENGLEFHAEDQPKEGSE